MGATNQAVEVGIGLPYRHASLSSLATRFQTRCLESIPRPVAGLERGFDSVHFHTKSYSLPVLEEKLHEPGNSLDKSAAHVAEGHVLLALVEEDVPELVLVHAVPPPTLHHHVVQLADHLVLELLQHRVSTFTNKLSRNK
jgi:hypothetical protein